MNVFYSSLDVAVAAGAVIVLAGLGLLLSERVGVLSLGVEGTITFGAVAAVITADVTNSAVIALAVGIIAGAATGLVHALGAVVLRANQILTGLAVFILFSGLANTLGRSRAGRPVGARLGSWAVPGLSDIPGIGPALFDHPPIVLATYTLLPLAIWFLLQRTRHGVNLRAVGENSAAADSTGVGVMKIRTMYTMIGASLGGAAGAYLVLSFTPGWNEDVAGGRGWVALALVIFARWRPFRLAIAGLLFGLLVSIGFTSQARNWGFAPALLSMMPFLVTVISMIVPAVIARIEGRSDRSAGPASLAVPYFREQR